MDDIQRRAKTQMRALAEHLRDSRDVLLQEWRRSVERDPTLTTAGAVSRAQFYDHIPEVLDAFVRRLSALAVEEREQARADERASAGKHGVHRWQQGYDQRETMREWGRLHLCLLAKVEDYTLAHLDADASVFRSARYALAELINEGVSASVLQYSRLHQADAAHRVQELGRASEHIEALERQRAQFWREAAHDLRGSVSAISSASSLINREDAPERTRAFAAQVLDKNVTALRGLLDDLMTLARLEAGYERRSLAQFDAAQMLREFVEALRPLAAERNLFLSASGPGVLLVEGDAVKARRIAQNLVLNALKVTTHGGVRVTWGLIDSGELEQWTMCIQDTGPGFTATADPLSRALKHATDAAQEAAADPSTPSTQLPPAPTLSSQSQANQPAPTQGEGIGLSIVKRLCEILDATLELETAQGKGATFRITFPRRYS